jgi:hypothetical protein
VRTSFYVRHGLGLALIAASLLVSGGPRAVHVLAFVVGIALIVWATVAAVRGGAVGKRGTPVDFGPGPGAGQGGV